MSIASAELLLLLMPLAAVSALLLGRQQQRLAALKRETAHLGRTVDDLQSVFDQAPLGLAVFDRELRFVRINQLLADIHGAAIEEHLGRTMRDMVPDIALGAEGRLREVLRTGLPSAGTVFTAATAAQPGTLRSWREHLYPLLDGAHKVQGVMASVEEVTEQERLADTLRQSQQREQRRNRELDCVLHASPAGLVIASDRACERVKANAAAERLLRLHRGENPSLSAASAPSFLVYADGRQVATDQLPLQRAAADGEQTWGAHLTVRFPGGGETRLIVNAVPLHDESGEVIGAVSGFVVAGNAPPPLRNGPPLASGMVA